MMCQRKCRWLSLGWLFILGLAALRETQAVYHRHVGQFTAVGTYDSLLELSGISFMDDVEVGSYNKANQQITIKIPWISKALGADCINQKHHLLVDHEQHFRWAIRFFSKNDINHNRNHTAQLLAECEIDNDIMIKSRIHLIWDGVEYYRINEEVGQWENLKPEVKEFRYILNSPFWTDLRKRYMNEYCVNMLRKIIGYSSLRDNVPPEVTISRHINPEGSIILSCTATGFYPRSILLQWEKNGELGIWGKETSSGILPNMDSTFYLRLTLELLPEDSGTNYTCVVEHTEFKTPAVYPVPPEVTVSRHVNPEGRIILSCTATGFYPRSILLQWEKNGELGVWGQETSSGILPNMNSTFYFRLTLELPPEDSGTGFSCVVEHTELKTPAVYPVPEKPTMEKPLVLTLSIMLAVILLMSCAGAFILWKKKKSGVHVMRER